MAVVAWGQVAAQARALQARQARMRRFGALVIDLMVFSVLTTFINSVYGVTQVTGGTLPTGQSGYFSYSTVTAASCAWTHSRWAFPPSPGETCCGSWMSYRLNT